MFHLPFPVRDAATETGSGGLGALPVWDLTDLYADIGDATISHEKDLPATPPKQRRVLNVPL